MSTEDRKLFLAEDRLHGFSSDAPHNTGFMVLGTSAAPPEQKTIVVVGLPRGGTTMAAQCLAALGLPMGVPKPPPRHNFEDPDFVTLLSTLEPGETDLPKLRSLIQRRNEAHASWGFKLPMALNYLAVLETELRNPHFILVFRDIVAVGSRQLISIGMDALYAMRLSLVWQERMIDFAESSKSPCMLVSYEKALQFPAILVDLMANWSGCAATKEQQEQACATIEANNPIYVAKEDPHAKAVR